MTAFIDAPEFVFRGTFFALSLVGLLGVICFTMSTLYRLKMRYGMPAFVSTLGAILLFSFLFDAIRVRDLGRPRQEFEASPAMLPAWSVVLLTTLLLTVVCVCFVLTVRKRQSALTAMSVKEALAVLPVGLCFYDETGRLLLMNEQIDRECRETTGGSLSDGAAFWEDMCAGRTLPEVVSVRTEDDSVIIERQESVRCYKRIRHDFDGKRVWELSGADITREYSLKKELEEKNEELRRMNLRMRQYGETVEQVTKERETLAARVKVHDSMGSLLLTTKKALSQGAYDRQELIALWDHILSFIYSPRDTSEDKFAEAAKTAESVGVTILYEGVRPAKASQAERILATALFECITNTARHADGDTLTVRVSEDGAFYTAVLMNNGKPPQGEIKEGGGLSSLRTMVENAGGRMRVESAPHFRLSVRIPKEEITHER